MGNISISFCRLYWPLHTDTFIFGRTVSCTSPHCSTLVHYLFYFVILLLMGYYGLKEWRPCDSVKASLCKCSKPRLLELNTSPLCHPSRPSTNCVLASASNHQTARPQSHFWDLKERWASNSNQTRAIKSHWRDLAGCVFTCVRGRGCATVCASVTVYVFVHVTVQFGEINMCQWLWRDAAERTLVSQ